MRRALVDGVEERINIPSRPLGCRKILEEKAPSDHNIQEHRPAKRNQIDEVSGHDHGWVHAQFISAEMAAGL